MGGVCAAHRAGGRKPVPAGLATLIHHCPFSLRRPIRSVLPSQVKLKTAPATFRSFQVIDGLITAHRAGGRKPVPAGLATLIHHCPFSRSRPIRSVLPSPVKSPTRTSTQCKLAESGAQVVHSPLAPLGPTERETHHCPFSSSP